MYGRREYRFMLVHIEETAEATVFLMIRTRLM